MPQCKWYVELVMILALFQIILEAVSSYSTKLTHENDMLLVGVFWSALFDLYGDHVYV